MKTTNPGHTMERTWRNGTYQNKSWLRINTLSLPTSKLKSIRSDSGESRRRWKRDGSARFNMGDFWWGLNGEICWIDESLFESSFFFFLDLVVLLHDLLFRDFLIINHLQDRLIFSMDVCLCRYRCLYTGIWIGTEARP